ncbi:DUF1405 domain-containing protein [Alkalicoccus daliensis]|uniref:Uncharacterized membrane protein YpjA n=1 Tax=Alkalicoccus daliensis TaxID=745820 RepID=A0A1H0ATM4_9BACI|nr:DUF1405 domain-containing protein [Alkalicoccus daliensis]SDN36828.1 Uncharacterized membrane protein YpjA [Alkalicoccus daliensis]
MKEYILGILRSRGFLWALFIVNFLGTVYGYIWYDAQLLQTPWYFLIFVPDSPTASLFFTIVLGCFLAGKRFPLMEALAAVTLIKYGIWAVIMNLAAGAAGTPLNILHWMLVFSHAGMALQAVLYLPYFRIKNWHLAAVALWTVHNDFIDYIYGMHPWVSRSLTPYISEIGYFTFWLSIASIAAVYYMNKKYQADIFSAGISIDADKNSD